jgi:hypothetical protein
MNYKSIMNELQVMLMIVMLIDVGVFNMVDDGVM